MPWSHLVGASERLEEMKTLRFSRGGGRCKASSLKPLLISELINKPDFNELMRPGIARHLRSLFIPYLLSIFSHSFQSRMAQD